MDNIIDFKTGEPITNQLDADWGKLIEILDAEIERMDEVKPRTTRSPIEIASYILTIIASILLGVCLHSIFGK